MREDEIKKFFGRKEEGSTTNGPTLDMEQQIRIVEHMKVDGTIGMYDQSPMDDTFEQRCRYYEDVIQQE